MTESMSNNAADFVNSSKYNDKKTNWFSSYKFGINKQWSHGQWSMVNGQWSWSMVNGQWSMVMVNGRMAVPHGKVC